MNRFYYLLLIISLAIIPFLYSPMLQAQQPVSKTKKEMILDLLESGRRTYNSDPDSSILYSSEALKHAKSLNVREDVAVAYKQLAIAYNSKNEYEKVQIYFDKAIDIYEAENDQENVVKLQYKKAKVYSSISDFIKAVDYFKPALNYAIEQKDSALIAPISLDFGIVYARKGDYYAALQYFLRSLNAYKAIGDKKYTSAISNNIGNLYREMGQLEKALVYFQETEKILGNKEEYQTSKIALYINIGLVYIGLEDYDKALENDEMALDFCEKIDGDQHKGVIYNNIGEVYQLQEKYHTAISFYEKAMPFRKKNDNKEGLAKTLQGLAISNKQLGKYNLALTQIQEALNINISIDDREGKKESLKTIASIYEIIGTKEQAFNSLKEYVLLKDSLNRENRIENILKIESEYKFKEEEMLVVSEVEILRKDQKIQESRQTILLLSLVSVIIALFAAFWFFYQNKKKTDLLEKDLENKVIIERQAKALEEASKAKSRFFTNIAHELRTPITLIAGPINNVLTRHKVNKSIKQELYIAQKNTTQLKQLVNQILDLSKSDFKKLKANTSTFNFLDLYNFLVEEFSSYATYQNIHFHTNTVDTSDFTITTDGEKLFIILKNLLSNAFKFTPNHGNIHFQYLNTKEHIEIVVKDDGQGIHPEDLPHIFERYFQTKQNNISAGGTGIGLTTSKEYIKLLGGQITIKSEFGNGSIFKVVVPKKIDAEHTVENHNLPFVKSGQSIPQIAILKTIYNPTIVNNLLIVEDNPEICHHLQTILQNEYNVTFAHNGKEALKLLEKQQPNLIITDLMMPVMDGFELLKRLKQHEMYRNIPVITLSARAQLSDKLKALTIGLDDYLVKPFDETELKASIKNLLTNLENRMHYQEILTEGAVKNADQPNSELASSTSLTISHNNDLNAQDLEWLRKLQDETEHGISNLNFNVNHLSEAMSLSTSQLYRKIKSLTGLTPKRYMQQVRFHEARKLLEERKVYSVKAASYSVGFKDEKHFSRMFKQRFGKSPSEYL